MLPSSTEPLFGRHFQQKEALLRRVGGGSVVVLWPAILAVHTVRGGRFLPSSESGRIPRAWWDGIGLRGGMVGLRGGTTSRRVPAQ